MKKSFIGQEFHRVTVRGVFGCVHKVRDALKRPNDPSSPTGGKPVLDKEKKP